MSALRSPLAVMADAGKPAVHIAPDVGGDIRAGLAEADMVMVDYAAAADLILAGPGGWPGSDVPVVSLGGTAFAAGRLGVDAPLAQIVAALQAVAAGLIVHAPGHAAGFAPVADPGIADLLTPREIDVLRAMGEGGSNKLIARQLGISLHTVKFYVEAIFRKLDAHSRAEAVAKGLRRQIVDTVKL